MKQVLGLMVVVAQILGTVTGNSKWYLIETEDETGPGYGTGVPDKGEHPVLSPSILPDDYDLYRTGDTKIYRCTDVNGTMRYARECWRHNCFIVYCCDEYGNLDGRSSDCNDPWKVKSEECEMCYPDGGEDPNILPSDPVPDDTEDWKGW